MAGKAASLVYLLRDGTLELTGSIDHTPFTIGRSPESDMVFAHPYVSRHHAAVLFEQEHYQIVDQGSRHGTFVNGQRVTRRPLSEGDSIHFGAVDGPMLRVGGKAAISSSTLNQILGQLPAINASNSALAKLRWFFESARKLNTHGAVDQILAVLLETTLQLTQVERGYVFLRGSSGKMELALGRASTGENLTDDESLSRSAIEKATSTASEYIVTDTLSEDAVARSESIVAHNIRAVICIPLRSRRQASTVDNVLGLLYLDSRLTAGSLTQIDSELLRTISTEAAALIDNAQLSLAEESERRYREELKIAAEIQQGLMTVHIPSVPFATTAARSIPCKEVGGDFYDVIDDGKSLAVVIADVSGKGVSAAILASTLQGMLYSQLLARQPLDRIAEVANRYICGKNVGKYATLAILRLYPDGTLEYINCGHIQPLLCSASGPQRLPASNLPVGLIEEASFEQAVIQVEHGTRVLLATDGVTEAENVEGDFYGDDRLEASINQCATLDAIYEQMHQFCGSAPPSDDCTMLEIVYRG